MNIENITKCYSCHGCENICHLGAIVFSENEYGIEVPIIDKNKCIDCGRCYKQCTEDITNSAPYNCILLESKKDEDLLTSSSGGAFFKIVEAFLCSEDDYVVGASYNSEFVVKHMCTSSYAEAEGFKKSKYVQSKVETLFYHIKGLLDKDKRVLFSGTPCQVYGLKKFLGSNYNNLYTIDLICTGVLAPVIFKRFINNYSNVTGFDWRYKHPISSDKWNIMDSTLYINGELAQDKHSINLKRLYGRRIGYKESCYSCKFSKPKRYSDITLGDYWSEKSCFSDTPNRGTSVILINSEKGEYLTGLIDKSQINEKSIDLSEIIIQNPALTRSTSRPDKNNMFWQEFYKKDIHTLLRKYTRNSLKSNFKMFVASLLPERIVEALRHKSKG